MNIENSKDKKPGRKTAVSKYMSSIARQSHIKSPRPREFYQEIGKKGGLSRKPKEDTTEK